RRPCGVHRGGAEGDCKFIIPDSRGKRAGGGKEGFREQLSAVSFQLSAGKGRDTKGVRGGKGSGSFLSLSTASRGAFQPELSNRFGRPFLRTVRPVPLDRRADFRDFLFPLRLIQPL